MHNNKQQNTLSLLGKVLKEAGIKLTHQRLETLREVRSSIDHPDAETIHRRVKQRIPTISLDTIYRTLWTLTDAGLISILGNRRGGIRFDGNIDSHHHFICSSCYVILDFFCDDFDRLQIPDAVKELGEVSSSTVDFKGVCKKCHDRNP